MFGAGASKANKVSLVAYNTTPPQGSRTFYLPNTGGVLATEKVQRLYTYIYRGSLFTAIINLKCDTNSSSIQVTENSNINAFFSNHGMAFGKFHAVSGLLLNTNNNTVRGEIYGIQVNSFATNFPYIVYYDTSQDASDTMSLSSGAYPLVSVYGGYIIPN